MAVNRNRLQAFPKGLVDLMVSSLAATDVLWCPCSGFHFLCSLHTGGIMVLLLEAEPTVTCLLFFSLIVFLLKCILTSDLLTGIPYIRGSTGVSVW